MTTRSPAGPSPLADLTVPASGPAMPGLAGLARVPLAVLPTPLLTAPRLAAAAGMRALLIKRDDLTGFGFGGNKPRVLEFLLGAATGAGADTLVTGGAPGSNFCAAAAAAAQRAGLRCHLVIAGGQRAATPALTLARSWDATVSWTGSTDRSSVDGALPAAASELAARGHRPYLIPRGGASALGAVGYALAAGELAEQLTGLGVEAARLVVPVGSGGTLAGLVAGNVLLGRPWTVTGGSVSRPPAETAGRVLALARGCLRLLAGAAGEVTADDVLVADVRGPGHGLPSAAGTVAARQSIRTEGVLADPAYTAKALALAVGPDQLPPGAEAAGPVVFWHTGGILDAVAEPVAGPAGPRP